MVWPVVANPGCIGKSLNLKDNSGEGGIRTHGGVTPTPVFETGLFNRSSTSPNEADKGIILRDQTRFAAALVVYGLEVFCAVTGVPALSCWINAFATSSTEIALMHSTS